MSPVHIWLMCISVTAPLPGVRWRRLCQAALQACLSTGTLRGGAEQRAPLQPSCVQECLQGAQLAVWHTAVHVARSCLQDAQLSAGCTAVCLQAVPVFTWHSVALSSAWNTSVPGCSALQGTAISRCTAISEHTAVCGVHSWLRTHSCLQNTQLSAAAEFQ